MMALFCKNIEQLLAVNCFRKKDPSQMFDRVLNTCLFTDKSLHFWVVVAVYSGVIGTFSNIYDRAFCEII